MRRLLAGLLAGLLCGSPVWAEWVPHLFLNNAGGLNDGFDPTAIEDNQAADLQNVLFTTGGAIAKRLGFTRINASAISSTATFTGVAFFRTSSGTRSLFAAVEDGATDRFYSMSYGAGTSGPTGAWTNRTGSLVLSFGVNNQADVAVAQDRLLITDGVGSNPIYTWTGTGNAATLGSGPNASMIEYHHRIAWAAGDTAAPSTLSFSNLDDVTTWTTTDTLVIEPNDNQIIRALKSALDCLYVFKDESIWRVCGTNRDDFVTEQMVRGIGTRSNQSVVMIDNQFYFVTSQGQIAVYDGGINYKIISPLITTTITGLNRDRFTMAVATSFDEGTGIENYYVSMSGGGSATNNTILEYDLLHHAFTKFIGLAANAMAVYEIGTQQKAIVFGDYGGFANRYPNGNSDAGALINAYYLTKQFGFPETPQDKTWRVLEVFANQTGAFTMTANTLADFESPGTATTISLNGSGALWDSAIWDTDSWSDLTTTINRIEVNKRRRFFQARFSDNSTNPAFVIKAFSFWIEPEGRI